jgi:hypothetical protein
MGLPLPQIRKAIFVTCPVFNATKSSPQIVPEFLSLVTGMILMSVEPVLESVDGGDPGKQNDHFFQKISIGSPRLFFVVNFIQESGPQQLHSHGGNFTELDRGLPIEKQRVVSALQRMKSVATLMEKSPDIPIDAYRIHKNKGQPDFTQGALVPPRCLAFAALEIEEALLAEEAEVPAKVRIDATKNLLAPFNQIF